MLDANQQDQLLVSLFVTAEAMGQNLTKAAGQLMVEDLCCYEESALANALRAVRRQGGRFTVDAVLKHVEAADGRPEANEAWAIALQSFDESDTVLMTPEIRQAAAVAAPIAAGRDKVGARMAFIAAYERLVAEARRAAVPVAWSLSLGHDSQRRVEAIQQAVRLQRLSAPAAQLLLEEHCHGQPTAEGQAIAGLLTGRAAKTAISPETSLRLQGIRDEVLAQSRRRAVQKRWDHRKALRTERERKQAVLDRIEQLQAGQVVRHV